MSVSPFAAGARLPAFPAAAFESHQSHKQAPSVLQSYLCKPPAKQEREVISALWERLELLLNSGVEAVLQAARVYQAALPAMQHLEHQDIPSLARLHMSCSSKLRERLLRIAPGVFTINMLEEVEGSPTELATALIEVQLFHLQRARALLEHYRNGPAAGVGPRTCEHQQ